jgi:hypothetical protein
LSINDGVGNFLTGNVDWVEVDTYNYAGGINSDLIFNVTDMTYAGTNVDLLTLVAESPGSMDLTFQFSPGKMLSRLTTGSGPYDTTFSGSLSVVPEPTSLGLVVVGLAASAGFHFQGLKRLTTATKKRERVPDKFLTGCL